MKHFHHKIPGWFGFEDAYREAVARAKNGDIFVEVGCWKGRSTAFLAVEIVNSRKDIRLYCVDHWQGSDEDVQKNDPDLLRLYDVFLENMRSVEDVIVPLRATSVEAAARFSDGALALVWLDASHDYDSVRADIAAWRPKVKPGGILGGDDFGWTDVRRAVTDSFAHVSHAGRYPYWWTEINFISSVADSPRRAAETDL